MPFACFPRPLLFGHRGASARAPENTLRAFELAVEAGVDVLEMDVHLSCDGVVVVHHDASLDRTTNATGLVRELSWSELRRLDAGYRFRRPDGTHPFRGSDCRVPRLSEVLEAFPSVGFNIEIKQRDPPMISAVLAELQRFPPKDVVLAAADSAIMRALEAARPGVALGLSAEQCWSVWWHALFGRVPESYRGRSLQVPPRYRGVLPVVPQRVMRAVHAAGLEVHLWTINDERLARHWLSCGADGIMSDDPLAIRAAVHEARRPARTG